MELLAAVEAGSTVFFDPTVLPLELLTSEYLFGVNKALEIGSGNPTHPSSCVNSTTVPCV